MARNNKKAPPPDRPLANPRHEAFCGYVASGSALGPAWAKASLTTGHPVSGNANAQKSTAHKTSQIPAVAARIRFLKQEAAERAKAIALPENLTKSGVATLANECITALQDAYKACLDDPGATAPQRERLLQTLSQHLARTAKYTDDDAEVDAAEMATTTRRMTDRLLTWHDCKCGGRHA